MSGLGEDLQGTVGHSQRLDSCAGHGSPAGVRRLKFMAWRRVGFGGRGRAVL